MGNEKGFANIIIIIGLVIAAAVGGYFILEYTTSAPIPHQLTGFTTSPTATPFVSPSATPLPNTSASPTAGTSSSPMPNASANTFTNTKYGYSVQYPGNWTVDTTNANSDFTLWGGYDPKAQVATSDGSSLGGSVYFYPSNKTQTNGLVFNIRKPDPAISVDQMVHQWIQQIQGPLPSVQVINSTINGLPAVYVISPYTSSSGFPGYDANLNVFIEGKTKAYYFGYNRPISLTDRQVYETIITSFQLK